MPTPVLPRPRALPTALAGALAFMLLLAPRTAGAGVGVESWYILEMMGRKAGWMVERESTDDKGNIATEQELNLTVGRGPTAITISMLSTFIESPDGAPIRSATEQRQGAIMMRTRFDFEADGIRETSSQFGRESTRTHPTPEGEWMTPASVKRFLEERIEAGAASFTYRMLDTSMGLQVVDVTTIVVGPSPIEVSGKVVPAIEWSVRSSALPGAIATHYVDPSGRTLRTSFDLGAIKMVMLRAEKELALAEADAPELMASTLVEIPEPIARPRASQRGWYRLRIADGEMPELPETGAQRVKSLDDGSLRIWIDVNKPIPATREEIEDGAYLAGTAMLDTSDPEIIALTERATEDATDDPRDRAEAMRRFVHRYIEQKDLGVGFATASEVCRTRQGDCSEHGVLLAAMLRADGIPSRVVSGLIYVDAFLGKRNVFGYHMWTQALLEIDGELCWVDLDATLDDAQATDATHITLGASSTSNEEGSLAGSMLTLVSLLGRLELEVERVE